MRKDCGGKEKLKRIYPYTYTANVPPPLLYCPQLPSQVYRYVYPAKVEIHEYVAISDGRKKIYTNDDELDEYKSGGILCPSKVSYTCLWINGVLQPQAHYHVEEGKLILKTEDAPIKGSIIYLQMIKVNH